MNGLSLVGALVFWIYAQVLGLSVILPAQYAAAYPAMYWAMRRERKKGTATVEHH
jgi:hypothetical protein